MSLKSGVTGADGDAYIGHFVWVSAFNDDIKKRLDNDSITSREYLVADNCNADGNMWEWLAAQTK